MAYSILVLDDEALTLKTISRALREEAASWRAYADAIARVLDATPGEA